MDERHTDVKPFLTALYAGSLLLMAGISFELFICIHAIRHFSRLTKAKRKDCRLYIGTMMIIFGSSSVGFVVDCLSKLDTFNTYTLAPCCEKAALGSKPPAWWAVVGVVSLGIIRLSGDALLAWRCYIIWAHNRRVGLLPTILYLASLGVGLAYLITVKQTAVTETPWSNELYIKYQVAFFFLSVGVNVIATT
ncbi:hypothetical protein BKA70DRAFT_1562312, partial [Coprinopsis sp. MPI-PUGE-AT-0042]